MTPAFLALATLLVEGLRPNHLGGSGTIANDDCTQFSSCARILRFRLIVPVNRIFLPEIGFQYQIHLREE